MTFLADKCSSGVKEAEVERLWLNCSDNNGGCWKDAWNLDKTVQVKEPEVDVGKTLMLGTQDISVQVTQVIVGKMPGTRTKLFR